QLEHPPEGKGPHPPPVPLPAHDRRRVDPLLPRDLLLRPEPDEPLRERLLLRGPRGRVLHHVLRFNLLQRRRHGGSHDPPYRPELPGNLALSILKDGPVGVRLHSRPPCHGDCRRAIARPMGQESPASERLSPISTSSSHWCLVPNLDVFQENWTCSRSSFGLTL